MIPQAEVVNVQSPKVVPPEVTSLERLDESKVKQTNHRVVSPCRTIHGRSFRKLSAAKIWSVDRAVDGDAVVSNNESGCLVWVSDG